MQRPAISAFTLKIAAIVGMTCNHVANVFAWVLPGWLMALLCVFGGLTFPIMAFLLCDGFRYTSNIRRYAGRLAIFAVISQIPYSLLWGATANVLFTLLIGLVLLWAGERGLPPVVYGILVVAGVALSWFCDWGVIGPVMILLFWSMRQRPRGVMVVMLVPLLAMGLPALSWTAEELAEATTNPLSKTALEQLFGTNLRAETIGELETESPAETFEQTINEAGKTPSEPASTAPQIEGSSSEAHLTHTVSDGPGLAASLGVLGYYTLGFGLATLLMLSYNGTRGKPLKWFFYGYYPGHLMVLWIVAHVMGA